MPPRSRRALLALLGSATAPAVAGCRTTDTETQAETDSPTGSPSEPRCDPAPRPDAWPVGRRSPARDGYVVAPQGFTEAPTTAWEAEPSASSDGYASPRYGRPVVAGGRVYLLNLLDRGPQRPLYGHVHALDAATGERRWASERLRSPEPPVVRGDLVAVLAENDAREARLLALDRTDGSRRWTREFASRADALVGTYDRLYLALGEGTGERAVHALDDGGTPVWDVAGDHGPLATDGETIYVVGASDGGRQALRALDAGAGEPRWSVRAPDVGYQPPVVAGDTLLVALGGSVVALDRADGTERWRTDRSPTDLAVADGTVFGTDRGTLVALR
jgi:outer membrane protein assembly factor BamB